MNVLYTEWITHTHAHTHAHAPVTATVQLQACVMSLVNMDVMHTVRTSHVDGMGDEVFLAHFTVPRATPALIRLKQQHIVCHQT